MLAVKSYEDRYKSVWRLEIFSYSSVNCFGLISGAIGYKKYKFSNLIYIWFITEYYSIIFGILSLCFGIKLKEFLLFFFPILKRHRWYINAYFIMYLFLPFINYGINNLNQITYKMLVIFYILFFSFYHIIHLLLKTDEYSFLYGGGTSFWLIILYIIGAYFGKYFIYEEIFTNKIEYFCIFIYLFLFFLSEIKLETKLFVSHLSPTILIQSISLLIIFSRLKIKNALLIRYIRFVGPITLSATFFHDTIFRHKFQIVLSFFKMIRNINYKWYFFEVFGISILIFLCSNIFDLIRLFIFKILNLRKICLFLENKIPEIIKKKNL